MAVLVYFKKLDEDDEKVRYRFGGDRETMSRTIEVDKQTLRPIPPEGDIDHQFLVAGMKIVRTFKEKGVWPESGTHAS